MIAGLLRSKEALASYVPEEEVQVLRELVRLRHHLQKDKKNYLRKAYSLLNLVFPEYSNLIKSPFNSHSTVNGKYLPFRKKSPLMNKDFPPFHPSKIAQMAW